MEKTVFTAPETEIVEFDMMDVIVTSGDDDETDLISEPSQS